MRVLFTMAALVLLSQAVPAAERQTQVSQLDQYNVIWTTQSQNAGWRVQHGCHAALRQCLRSPPSHCATTLSGLGREMGSSLRFSWVFLFEVPR